MVLNTQSYMWDGIGMVGYLLGPTLRAPYGANNDNALKVKPVVSYRYTQSQHRPGEQMWWNADST